jgi:hypothetical protein
VATQKAAGPTDINSHRPTKIVLFQKRGFFDSSWLVVTFLGPKRGRTEMLLAQSHQRSIMITSSMVGGNERRESTPKPAGLRSFATIQSIYDLI